MKACLLHKIGDIRFEEVKKPVPKADQVLIKVKACGLCGSDIPRILETGTYSFPMIPGHEFAGEIVAMGANVDGLMIKDRGAVIPLIPCKQCLMCKVGKYELCNNYNYLGSRTNGALAEYVVAPATNFIKLPNSVLFEEAAMTEPASVGLHTLRNVKLDFGDTVTVLGSGTIGLIIAQLANIWGAKDVLLVDIDDQKLEIAKNLGFANTFNSQKGDPVSWVNNYTSGEGVDIVIESAGVSDTISQAIRMAKKEGKIGLVGNQYNDVVIKPATYSQLLRKQLSVHGSWNSTFCPFPKDEWRLIINMLEQKRIKLLPLITHKYRLAELDKLLALIENNNEFFNKIMFVN